MSSLPDEAFFADHSDRNFRIRLPAAGEYANEFRSLGPHEEGRRRVIVSRVPFGIASMSGITLMPIPFLAFADEEIADRDDVLSPIFRGILEKAGADIGILGPARGW
jgi:hypothetical protein